VRLIVALSIAAVLAVFLLYTSFAGGATKSLRPKPARKARRGSAARRRRRRPVNGDARGAGMRFTLKDFDGPARVAVVYTGSVPDLFRGRAARLPPRELENGVFVAEA
jgi:hypothetical protein